MDAGKNQRNPAMWPITNLGKIATLLSGGTPDRSRSEFWNGGLPWLSAKDLKSFYVGDSIEKVSEEGIAAGSRQVPKGSILILVRGMTLLKDVPIALTTGPVAFNQDLKAIVPDDGVNPDYLACWLVASKDRLLSCVDQAGHGTGRLPTDLLRTLPVYLPPPAIQDKLAKMFGYWHRALDITSKLLKAKQRFKQGLMRQLLAGGLRFVKYKGEHWRRCRLGEVFTQIKRTGIAGLPVLSVTIGAGVVRRTSLGRKIDSELVPERHLMPKQNDLVYNMMRAWQGAIGVAGESGLVSPAYVVCSPHEGVDSRYFCHLLKSPYMLKKLRDYSAGLTDDRLRLYFNNFAAIPIVVPSSTEQRRITQLLDTIDKEIEILTLQADAFARQKQGLLEKLLTGQIRVRG